MGFPAWASVGAGRGGQGLVWDLPSAPSSTPGQPTGLQSGGLRAGESTPGARSEPPLLSFGASKRRPGHPISRKEGGGREASPALQISSPVLALRSSLTSGSPSTSIVPYTGHGTKIRGNANLGPQGAGKPVPRLAQGGPGAGSAGCSPARELCLTCGEAAEKEGEGRPQSQG